VASRITGVVVVAKHAGRDLPPTISSGTIGTIDLANPEHLGALQLERTRARRPDADFDLHLNPAAAAPARRACHLTATRRPTRGSTGAPRVRYIVEDGGFGASPVKTTSAIPADRAGQQCYRNQPFGASQTTLDAGATFARRSAARSTWSTSTSTSTATSANGRRRRAERDGSANSRSRSRPRASYQWITRDGDDIDYGIYARYETQSFPGFVPCSWPASRRTT
jgi:hypothetical protein